MERLVKTSLAIDGGKRVRTKGQIIEQDVSDQEELQALVEVAKQKNFAGRKQRWLMSKPSPSRVEWLPCISRLPLFALAPWMGYCRTLYIIASIL